MTLTLLVALIVVIALAEFGFAWFVATRIKAVSQMQEDWGKMMAHARDVRSKADKLFDTAEQFATKAVDHDYRVCSNCDRIVTKHQTNDSGKTLCVLCVKDLATRGLNSRG